VLQAMKAAIVEELPSAPHETLLVVDGSLGRNAVDQAAAWRKYVFCYTIGLPFFSCF
jgi:signal recognition particle GTPase